MDYDKDAFNVLVLRESMRGELDYLVCAMGKYPDVREVLYVPDEHFPAHARACVYNYRVAYKIINRFRQLV